MDYVCGTCGAEGTEEIEDGEAAAWVTCWCCGDLVSPQAERVAEYDLWGGFEEDTYTVGVFMKEWNGVWVLKRVGEDIGAGDTLPDTTYPTREAAIAAAKSHADAWDCGYEVEVDGNTEQFCADGWQNAIATAENWREDCAPGEQLAVKHTRTGEVRYTEW